MALHFSAEEFAGRRRGAIAAMVEAKLDGLLTFRQESMYYLTGYDTFGYVYFQCLYLGADGALTLLTRAPDLLQAKHTSVISDIRIWVDAPDAKPAEQLRDVLASHGCKGKRLGVEWEAYGLTARNGQRLETALEEWSATRERLIDFVRSLDGAQRTLTGQHERYGDVTVDRYLEIALEHDRDHLRSLERLAGEVTR